MDWTDNFPQTPGEYLARYDEYTKPFLVVVTEQLRTKESFFTLNCRIRYAPSVTNTELRLSSEEEKNDPDYLEFIKYWTKIL
jgi:hypothetical protein